MKFGMRTPSFKKSFKARTTGKYKRQLKRSINPYYGKKGMGWLNNPKKAMYNKIYNKTTFSVFNLPKTSRASSKSNSNNAGCLGIFALVICIALVISFWQYILAFAILGIAVYYFIKK